ncbi:hypothetical protein Dimus_036771 [Dionaea muscipula]
MDFTMSSLTESVRLAFPEEGFIYYEANALALAVSLFLDNWLMLLKWHLLIEMSPGRRLRIWKKRSRIFANAIKNYPKSMKPHKDPCGVRRVVRRSLENQSTSRLTALKKAESYCEESEQKIERLEKRITEPEQQRPTYMNEIVDLPV